MQTMTPTRPPAEEKRPEYPLDVALAAMKEKLGWFYTLLRLMTLPVECLLRKKFGWQYLSWECWLLMVPSGLIIAKYRNQLEYGWDATSISAMTCVFCAVYGLRVIWLQLCVLYRSRWDADYTVPAYAGGVSWLRIWDASKDPERAIRRERLIRLFVEPPLTAWLGYRLMQGGEGLGIYLLGVSGTMFIKQVIEWQFVRRRVQDVINKKDEASWFQKATYGRLAHPPEEEIPEAMPVPRGPHTAAERVDIAGMKARMPTSLQELMGHQGAPADDA